MKMESCSLQSSTITTIPTSLSKTGLLDRTSIHGQLLRFPSFNKYPHARKLKILDIKAQSSGITKFSSGAVEAVPEGTDVKDDNLAFAAGATGSLSNLAFEFQLAPAVEKLEIIEFDLEKPNQIVPLPALGNASVVLCCIGASEKEVFDVTGPYRIDYQATKNLIDAATVAKVKHFLMVSSLGTNKVGFPAAILNLFWGVLIWKRKAEEALIASGIPYTVSTSRLPTNIYIYICLQSGGIAQTTAPLLPMDTLLTKIPSQHVLPKEPVAIEGPEPVTLKKVVTEPPSPCPPIKKDAEQPKAVIARPLYPCTVYEDLKPPSSPSPTASGPKEEPLNA